jgi:anti-sigma factor RsiW
VVYPCFRQTLSMPCTHCPHCTAADDLRLPDPPGTAPGLAVAYYRRFLQAHAAASAVSAQPLRLLRQVNPWLTTSQAKAHLARARAIPAGALNEAPTGQVSAILSDPWIQGCRGIPVTERAVAAMMPGHDPGVVMSVLADAGWTRRSDGSLLMAD